MTRMDEKVLDAVKAVITDAGFDPVLKPVWANTGTIYVQEAGNFTTLATIAYDFQNTNATIYCDPLPGQVDGARGTASWPDSMPRRSTSEWLAFHVEYTDGSTVETMLAYIRKVLA